MAETQRVSRVNLCQGAVFLFVGLIWGMVVLATPFPQLALGAHIQLTGSEPPSHECKEPQWPW